MDARSLTTALSQKALQIGFDLVGAATADSPADFAYLHRWLDHGYAGEMRYFADRLEAYHNLNLVLEGAKSILMLGMNYRTAEPIEPQAGQGRVSRYAWGIDYHELIHERLRQLVELHGQLAPSGHARGVVDTAPLLERYFAVRAGLGWIGKNTLLTDRKFGSWIFLAALLTTEELDYSPRPLGEGPGVRADQLDLNNPCGNCRACLDACPTGALVAPYQLDAHKCISYLTIEHRGEIPENARSSIGNRLFGCDACQEACPWNRRTPSAAEPSFYPREGMNPADLADLQNLDEQSFRRRFRGTPMWRAKHAGILRNAAIVQTNGNAIKPAT